MQLALYAVSLGLLLAGYWWALNQPAPTAVRSGRLAIFGLWMGGGSSACSSQVCQPRSWIRQPGRSQLGLFSPGL
jgi:hypothetical protein